MDARAGQPGIDPPEQQCRQLRSKAAMANPSVAMQQLCVVVERVFTEHVPTSAWHQPWASQVKIESANQRRLLELLYEIATQYEAAWQSFGPEATDRALRTVTLGTMLLGFDKARTPLL